MEKIKIIKYALFLPIYLKEVIGLNNQKEIGRIVFVTQLIMLFFFFVILLRNSFSNTFRINSWSMVLGSLLYIRCSIVYKFVCVSICDYN